MDSVMVDMVRVQAIDACLPPGGRSPPAVTDPPRPQVSAPRPAAGAAPATRSGAGNLAAVEELLEVGGVHDGYAQLLGLFQLGRTRLRPQHHGPGPGRDAARGLAPPGQDRLLGLLPRVALDGPGDHDGAAGEGLGQLRPDGPGRSARPIGPIGPGTITRSA